MRKIAKILVLILLIAGSAYASNIEWRNKSGAICTISASMATVEGAIKYNNKYIYKGTLFKISNGNLMVDKINSKPGFKLIAKSNKKFVSFDFKIPDFNKYYTILYINGKKYNIRSLEKNMSVVELKGHSNYIVYYIDFGANQVNVSKVDQNKGVITFTASKENIVLNVYLGTTSYNEDPIFKGIYTRSFLNIAIVKSLQFIQKYVGSWGIAIIILTFIIRSILLYPLNKKQFYSMKKMQELQPLIMALQEAYKDDPQRLQMEIMKLYQEKNVSPFGGCLLALIQIPILIVMFNVLRTSIELKGASFLWIKDLTGPDQTGLLPFIVALSTYWQQVSAQPETKNNLSSLIMPLLILFIAKGLPSGVLIYWVFSGIFAQIDQYRWAKEYDKNKINIGKEVEKIHKKAKEVKKIEKENNKEEDNGDTEDNKNSSK